MLEQKREYLFVCEDGRLKPIVEKIFADFRDVVGMSNANVTFYSSKEKNGLTYAYLNNLRKIFGTNEEAINDIQRKTSFPKSERFCNLNLDLNRCSQIDFQEKLFQDIFQNL